MQEARHKGAQVVQTHGYEVLDQAQLWIRYNCGSGIDRNNISGCLGEGGSTLTRREVTAVLRNVLRMPGIVRGWTHSKP